MQILSQDHHPCSLRQRFELLRNDRSLCDVRLFSSDGTDFYAHSIYLAVHSEYFRLEGSTCRRADRRTSIAYQYHIDIPSNYLAMLLDYIYRGEVTISEENLPKLKMFALKLQFRDILEVLKNKETGHDLLNNGDNVSEELPFEEVLSISTTETKKNIFTSSNISNSGNRVESDETRATNEITVTTDNHFNNQGSKRKGVAICIGSFEMNRALRKSKRLAKSAKGTLNAQAEHDNVHLKIHPFKIKIPKPRIAISKKVQSAPSYVDSFDVSSPKAGRNLWVENKSDNIKTQDRRRSLRSRKTTVYLDSPIDSDDDCVDGHNDTDEQDGKCALKAIQNLSLVDQQAAKCLLSLSETILQAVEDTSSITKNRVKDSTMSCKFEPRGRCRIDTPAGQSYRSPKIKSNKRAKRIVKQSEKHSHKISDPTFCQSLNKPSGSKITSMKTSKPTVTRKRRRLVGLFTNKLAKMYLVDHCIRRAMPSPGSVHGTARCLECHRCQKKFRFYSSWRLHFRSVHLAFMQTRLKKVAKLESLKMPTTAMSAKTRKRKPQGMLGTIMLMKCGKLRKMPGPRCSVSQDAMMTCLECGVMLASRASLKTHLLCYHNLDKQQVEQHKSLLVHCEVADCAFANIDIQKVERHVRESHTEVRFPCPDCHRSFVRQDVLQQHVLRIHRQQTRFRCEDCDMYFKKSCDQKIHEQQVHRVDHGLEIFACSVEGCDFQTIMARYLQAHQKARHSDSRIQCPCCSVKVKTKLALQMHMNALHLKKRPFLCEVCGSSFCDLWTLQRHIAFRHSTKRDFTCSHCQYACNNRVQFMNHSYQQHGVKFESDKRKELTCPSCSYKALSACRMNAHIRHIHADPNKFTCEVCGKGFKNCHYLRDHQAIHSDKTYQCPHCDYSPWSSSKLRKHIRTQHVFRDVKPYSCRYCVYACTLSGNCRKHVVNKHPGREILYDTDKSMLAYMRKVEAELQTCKVKATTAKKSSNI